MKDDTSDVDVVLLNLLLAYENPSMLMYSMDHTTCLLVQLCFQNLLHHGFRHTDALVQFKFLWLHLSKLTQDVGCSMGFTYGVFTLFCFGGLVVSSYGYFVSGIILITQGLAFTAFFFSTILYVQCTFAQLATEEVSSRNSNCSIRDVAVSFIPRMRTTAVRSALRTDCSRHHRNFAHTSFVTKFSGFFLSYSIFPSNHHSAIAPYQSITTLNKQHISYPRC